MNPTTTPPNNDSKGYRFTETQDWFSGNIPLWTSFVPLVSTPNPRILEIGSWEGRSATFLLTSPLCATGGSIVCIDHFDLFATQAGKERHEKILHNLSLTGRPSRVIEKFSVPGLMTLLEEATKGEISGFDWLYIDGSHKADDTFLDAELAWRLANEGAIFIFDDYLWEVQPQDSPHHPKPGVDAFMKLHENEFEVISSAYQMVLQKKTKMHIGFLIESSEPVDIKTDAFGYSVNVVLVADASYAMPATVTIHSLIKHSSRRLTFYVIDCGLGADDKERMMSIVEDPNVSLVFVPLNDSGLGASLGPAWAKVDLIDLLPVERALYIDADILARGDVGRLWDINLDGKLLGACPDIGYPLGHENIERGPYFNSGVLLMDLTKIRGEVQKLRDVAKSMGPSPKLLEQDALNVHFRGAWKSLNLEWNAQGLGTYAELRTADRETVKLHEMADPILVHFTGPVSPSLPSVLNPHVQPCISKPWGYTKARGHPYAEEWWTTLKETPWAKWVESEGYRAWRDSEKEKAKTQAMEEFDKVVEA